MRMKQVKSIFENGYYCNDVSLTVLCDVNPAAKTERMVFGGEFQAVVAGKYIDTVKISLATVRQTIKELACEN